MQYDMAFIYKFNLSLKTMLNHISYLLVFVKLLWYFFKWFQSNVVLNLWRMARRKELCLQHEMTEIVFGAASNILWIVVRLAFYSLWRILTENIEKLFIHLCLLDMNYSFSLNYIVKLNERKLSEISIFSSKVFVAEGHKTFIQRNMI